MTEPAARCASGCYQAATHVGVLDVDGVGIVREPCCDHHRAQYYPVGAVYPPRPALPARPDAAGVTLTEVAAMPGFRVVAVEPISPQ